MSRILTLADQGELRLREDSLSGTAEVRLRAPQGLERTYALDLPDDLPVAERALTVSATGVMGYAEITPAEDPPEITVIESAEFTFDSSGGQSCVIAHGLGYTPTASRCMASWYKTGGADPILRSLGVLSTDGTNVTVYLYCPSWASQFKLKVFVWIYPEAE